MKSHINKNRFACQITDYRLRVMPLPGCYLVTLVITSGFATFDLGCSFECALDGVAWAYETLAGLTRGEDFDTEFYGIPGETEVDALNPKPATLFEPGSQESAA